MSDVFDELLDLPVDPQEQRVSGFNTLERRDRDPGFQRSQFEMRLQEARNNRPKQKPRPSVEPTPFFDTDAAIAEHDPVLSAMRADKAREKRAREFALITALQEHRPDIGVIEQLLPERGQDQTLTNERVIRALRNDPRQGIEVKRKPGTEGPSSDNFLVVRQ